MSNYESITSYESVWNRVYGEGGLSAKAEEWFLKNFPQRHATSIRYLAIEMLQNLKLTMREFEPQPGIKCGFHVRALELLVTYGIDYEPDITKVQKFHEFERKPNWVNAFQTLGYSWKV